MILQIIYKGTKFALRASKEPNQQIIIVHMKNSITQTPITFLIISLFFIYSFDLFPQRANNQKPESSGNRHKYESYQTGNSTLSSPADINFKKNNDSNFERTDNRYKKNKETRPRNERNKDQNDYADKRNYRDNEESENYFHIDKSGNTLWDGKHWNPDEFPLKVYVEESSSRHYKSTYKDYVSYAFNVWQKADSRVQYTFTNNSRNADIELIFVENLGKKYDENYLGLTEYDMNRNNEIEYSKIQISLLKLGNKKVSDGEIKATIIHELGHAFGLGHSENEGDIMYPFIDPDHSPDKTYDELSRGDKEAVQDVIDLGNYEQYVWK
jgi:predicted Zn-dependent protease